MKTVRELVSIQNPITLNGEKLSPAEISLLILALLTFEEGPNVNGVAASILAKVNR